jgi:hypothetical protein
MSKTAETVVSSEAQEVQADPQQVQHEELSEQQVEQEDALKGDQAGHLQEQGEGDEFVFQETAEAPAREQRTITKIPDCSFFEKGTCTKVLHSPFLFPISFFFFFNCCSG